MAKSREPNQEDLFYAIERSEFPQFITITRMAMRFFTSDTGNVDAYYEPNSFSGSIENAAFSEPPLRISGDADRCDQDIGSDDYIQPGNLFRLFNDDQKGRLFSNIAEAMQGVPQYIIERQLVDCDKADPDYGDGVRQALADIR